MSRPVPSTHTGRDLIERAKEQLMIDPSNTILVVEDSDDDVFALKRAIKKAGIGNPLQVVTDGQQAIDYLTAAADAARRAEFPLPFLVLLDLKLPYRDGFQVLEWIRGQAPLEAVVVVMLTGSDEPRDHERAHALGARSYLVKPAAGEDIKRLVDSLESSGRTSGAGPVMPSTGAA
jgi:CheY-like chemotaxis protein